MRPGTWCADSPHHITSVFVPVRRAGHMDSGSIGVGVSIEPRLRACLSGDSPRYPSTVSRVIRLYGLEEASITLTIHMPLPPAVGYAVSAASAVAASLIIGRIRGRGYSEALQIAHLADIMEETGLGDVLAISCGVGIVYRKKPGGPGVGEVECLQLPGTLSLISIDTGVMSTGTMLKTLDSGVYGLAEQTLRRIDRDFTVESFIYWSERFSRESGFLKAALAGREIPKLPGQVGVYGKKRVVVFFVEREWVGDAVSVLESRGFEPRILGVSSSPPGIWWS